MSLTQAEVDLCNQSLGAIGAGQITLSKQNTNEAIQCNLHYPQARDSLQRSFEWNFASVRAKLTPEKLIIIDTVYWETQEIYYEGETVYWYEEGDNVTPVFGYEYQYVLPDDFSRFKRTWYEKYQNWSIEENKLLIDDDVAYIEYIKKVTNPANFDPLFTECLILTLALKLVPSLAGTKAELLENVLLIKLRNAVSRARAVCASERGKKGYSAWNNARFNIGTMTGIERVSATPSKF